MSRSRATRRLRRRSAPFRVESRAECVIRLFETLAAKAPQSRMRDALHGDGLNAFRSAVADLIVDLPLPARASRRRADRHSSAFVERQCARRRPAVRPFGRRLRRLIGCRRRPARSAVRTAPGRALLVLGVSAGGDAKADRRGGRARLHRRSRRSAPARGGLRRRADLRVGRDSGARDGARDCGRRAGAADGEIIHVSGCAKGCAHPAPRTAAVFGRDAALRRVRRRRDDRFS